MAQLITETGDALAAADFRDDPEPTTEVGEFFANQREKV